MNILNNFLRRIFGMTMVFFYQIVSNSAFAYVEKITTPEQDPKIKNHFISENEVEGRVANTLTICPSGYYLHRCWTQIVGTNWLKGMTKTIKPQDGTSSSQEHIISVKTPDYYSYDETNSNNMDNLRKFFKNQEFIIYKGDSVSVNNASEQSVGPDMFVPYRNQILSNFCTNVIGELSNYECRKCPNNAMVSRSTVKQDSQEDQKLLWDSWDVHTIADCYLQEFKDDKGTYVYVANSATRNKNNGLNCYYNEPFEGSELYY